MSKITFQQTTGKVWIDGALQKQVAYSGHGEGVNNPELEAVHMVGVIPSGLWRICTWVDHPHLGKMVAALLPISVPNLSGRSGFFIHGDNQLVNHTGSDGCIVMDPVLRAAVKNSGAQFLEVIR